MKKGQQGADSDQLIHRDVDPEQVIKFLEEFRQLMDRRHDQPSKLISMKVPIPLLEAFKYRAKLEGTPYQTLIKRLMLQHIKTS